MSEQDSPKPKAKKVSKAMKRHSARCFAVQALYQWHIAATPVHEIDAQFRVDNDMRDTDVQMFSEILHGVARTKSELDKAVEPFLDRALADLDAVELSVLRIGAYELMHRMEVPYKVAINESVELAKVFGASESHKYVNGILDKLAQRARYAEVNAHRLKD